MISIWWLLAAFIGGGWAGMLLVALMQISADPSKQSGCALDLDGIPHKRIRLGWWTVLSMFSYCAGR